MTTPTGDSEKPRIGPPLLPGLISGHDHAAAPSEPPAPAPPALPSPPPLRVDAASPDSTQASPPAQEPPKASAPPMFRPGAPVALPAEPKPRESSGGMISNYDMEDFRADVALHRGENAGTVSSASFPSAYEAPPEPKSRPSPALTYREIESRLPPEPEEETRGPSLIDRIRTDPNTRWAALVVVAVIAIVVLVTMRKVDPSVSIASLKKEAAAVDGKTVTVKGRIGEVFQMGSSYAYYLHQGRDTIAVFTRTRTPGPHEKVTVTGSISTGYLDGVPRLGLFESSAATKQ